MSVDGLLWEGWRTASPSNLNTPYAVCPASHVQVYAITGGVGRVTRSSRSIVDCWSCLRSGAAMPAMIAAHPAVRVGLLALPLPTLPSTRCTLPENPTIEALANKVYGVWAKYRCAHPTLFLMARS